VWFNLSIVRWGLSKHTTRFEWGNVRIASRRVASHRDVEFHRVIIANKSNTEHVTSASEVRHSTISATHTLPRLARNPPPPLIQQCPARASRSRTPHCETLTLPRRMHPTTHESRGTFFLLCWCLDETSSVLICMCRHSGTPGELTGVGVRVLWGFKARLFERGEVSGR
jgi:hypothetical protein